MKLVKDFLKHYSLTAFYFLVNIILFFWILGMPHRLFIRGDVFEYYGTTVSLIRHWSPELTAANLAIIKRDIPQNMIQNPEYYSKTKSGSRMAVHFPVYSLLNVPAVLYMKALGVGVLKSFLLTNILLFACLNFFVFQHFIKNGSKKLEYIILLYLSPLVYYLFWPGPEIYICSFLLLGLFSYLGEKRLWGILFLAIASWQSQPLAVLPGLLLVYELFSLVGHRKAFWRGVLSIILLSLVIVTPNLYFLFHFGVYHGQATLVNHGVPFFSFKRLSELLGDPNIGLFWFFPTGVVLGTAGLAAQIMQRKWRLDLAVVLLSLLAVFLVYTTTSNWNHGMSGYGPSRYALLFIPLFIVGYVSLKLPLFWQKCLLLFTVAVQVIVISANGGIVPLPNLNYQFTPLAKYLLSYYPNQYNPSFPIFMDRATHISNQKIITAIYQENGLCQKALLIKGSKQSLEKIFNSCGFIPEKYLVNHTESDLAKAVLGDREIWLQEANFWADLSACSEPSFYNLCRLANNTTEAQKLFKVKEVGRLIPLKKKSGWHLKYGNLQKINLPPGYVIETHTMHPPEAVYINFE